MRYRRQRNHTEKPQIPTTDINNPIFDTEDPYARIPFQENDPKDDDVYRIPEKVFKSRDKAMSQRALVENPYVFDGFDGSSTASLEPPYVTSSQIRPSRPGTTKSEKFDDNLKKDQVMLPPKESSNGTGEVRAIPNQYSIVEKRKPSSPNAQDQIVELPKTKLDPTFEAPPIPVRVDIESKQDDNNDDAFESQDIQLNPYSATRAPRIPRVLPERPDGSAGDVPPVPKRRMQSRSSVSKDDANQYESLGPRTFQKKTTENVSVDDSGMNPYDHLNREFNC